MLLFQRISNDLIGCRNTTASHSFAHFKASLDALALAKLVGVGGGGEILSMIAMACPNIFAPALLFF